MAAKEIRAVFCLPGEDAKGVLINNDYQTIHDMIGGYITAVRFDRRVVAYVHDEGLLEHLPWNRQIGPSTFIAGPILVVGSTPEGEDDSLTDKEEAKVLHLLNVVAPRMSGESSIEEYEKLTGRAAVTITVGDKTTEIHADGRQVERPATTAEQRTVDNLDRLDPKE